MADAVLYAVERGKLLDTKAKLLENVCDFENPSERVGLVLT